MSTETPSQTARALEDLRYRASDLTPTERFVVLAVAAQYDDRGVNATHPYFISEITGIARGKVEKIIDTLVDMGYLFAVDGLVSVYVVGDGNSPDEVLS